MGWSELWGRAAVLGSSWTCGHTFQCIHIYFIYPRLATGIGSAGQSMEPRLWAQSLHGPSTEGLDPMILVGHFQLRIFCHSGVYQRLGLMILEVFPTLLIL